MNLNYYHGYSDSRKSFFLIAIQNTSSKISINENKVSILSQCKDVCIVGRLSNKESLILDKEESLPIENEDIPFTELWLIDKENKVLDFHSQLTWPYRVSEEKNNCSDELYYSMIEKGEGLTCEFKPYIDLISATNRKAIEIEKTVCAFSNATGGILLIGVGDEGTIDGINDKVCKTYSAPIDESIQKYIQDISERLNNSLIENQCYKICSEKLSSNYVIVVSVSISRRPNYIKNTRQAFIRKGATSAKMPFADERDKYLNQ